MQGCRGGEVVFLGQWEEGTGSITGLKTSSGGGCTLQMQKLSGLEHSIYFTAINARGGGVGDRSGGGYA